MKQAILLVTVFLALAGASRARADFVDELPDLPITPAPLPSATAAPEGGRKGNRLPPQGGASGGAPSQGNTGGAGNAGNAGGTGSTGNAGGDPGPASGGTSGSTASGGTSGSTGSGGAGGGLFGSDVVKHDTQAPISTQGDVLEGSLNKGKMTLTGNVEIRQDDTLMKSDVAEVFSKPGTTSPERALARGNVSILKRPNPRVPELRAVAEELEYFINERRVILKGRPKIWRGKELLQGEVIEVALDTGDIRIRSARSIVDPRTQGEFSKGAKPAPKGERKK